MQTTNVWDKLPQETSRAYRAFQVYLLSPVYGSEDEKRSLKNTAKKLGLASQTGVENWSSKFNWVERATAYDAAIGTNAIQAQEVALKEYQEAVVSSLSAQLIGLNRILEKKIAEVMGSTGTYSTNDIKRLAEAVRIKDDLARRLGKMATNFTSEQADEDVEEETYFLVGSNG